MGLLLVGTSLSCLQKWPLLSSGAQLTATAPEKTPLLSQPKASISVPWLTPCLLPYFHFLLHALAVVVTVAEVALAPGAALIRRPAPPLDRLGVVLFDAPAGEIRESEIALRLSFALFGGLASRVFSNSTVQKYQFFGAQLSLW